MSSKNILEPTDEETLQCLFFPVTYCSEITNWESLCEAINDTIKLYSKNYIWHKDEFKVFIPVTENRTNVPLHLHSHTCFGDNIDDEWFIVWLVLELSRQYQNLVIHIKDSDGDFLLIEAADYLQTWANPENTENRVFIYRNHIHVIPPEVVSLESKLDLKTALKIVSESPESTQASNDVQQAISRRIGCYPDKLQENIHKAVVQLPSYLAALLILQPSIIAPIVNAYCTADIIDKKCIKDIDFKDCVTVEVKFTKFLYAMLMHSQLINSIKHCESRDKKNSLGLKITCGYLIVMKNSSNDSLNSKDYFKFLENLKQNGYFQNNIEGSREYNNLLKNAKEYFSHVETPINTHVSHSISQLMSSNDYIQIRDSLKDNKYMVDPDYNGDNDDWLNINPDQLNDVLLSRYGKTSKLTNNDILSSQAIATELSSILKQTSDYEGIESDRNEKREDNQVEFESDQFVACIEKMLNIISTGEDENTESEDDIEDYDDMEYNEDNNDVCDRELKSKLQTNQSENLHEPKTIISNIVKSLKEERASIGPTSNLLRTFGVHKSEVLDSDDDVD